MLLMFMVALVCLWVTPLKLKTQKTAAVLIKVSDMWNALMVFVFAALMEIQQFTTFIVGENCDAIKFYNEELHGYKCFDIVTLQ